MSSTNAAANSGAAKNNKEKKEVLSTITQTNGTPELSKFSVSAPEILSQTQPKTIQERIDRFYELERLIERRDSLVEHLDKLGGFHVSPTGSAHLKITDDKGGSFGIAHPIVIGEMVHLAKIKLKAELETVEAQIIL